MLLLVVALNGVRLGAVSTRRQLGKFDSEVTRIANEGLPDRLNMRFNTHRRNGIEHGGVRGAYGRLHHCLADRASISAVYTRHKWLLVGER